jgi:hypothetical protein
MVPDALPNRGGEAVGRLGFWHCGDRNQKTHLSLAEKLSRAQASGGMS